MQNDPDKFNDVIQRLKDEIAKLHREQDEAMKTAVYFGMTRQESQRYDERLDKIKSLVEQLARMVKSN